MYPGHLGQNPPSATWPFKDHCVNLWRKGSELCPCVSLCMVNPTEFQGWLRKGHSSWLLELKNFQERLYLSVIRLKSFSHLCFDFVETLWPLLVCIPKTVKWPTCNLRKYFAKRVVPMLERLTFYLFEHSTDFYLFEYGKIRYVRGITVRELNKFQGNSEIFIHLISWLPRRTAD